MQISCEYQTRIVILITDSTQTKENGMNQENVTQPESLTSDIALELKPQSNVELQQETQPESLAEEICRTANPVDVAKIKLTREDANRIASFVETVMAEQFRSFNGESRSLFKFDKKTFAKQMEAFIQHKDGLAGHESKSDKAKELANNLAVRWENYFIYSEIIQTWAKSYLEFKQSFR